MNEREKFIFMEGVKTGLLADGKFNISSVSPEIKKSNIGRPVGSKSRKVLFTAWTREEDDVLKENVGNSPKKISKILNGQRTPAAIYFRMHNVLKLNKSVSKPEPTFSVFQ